MSVPDEKAQPGPGPAPLQQRDEHAGESQAETGQEQAETPKDATKPEAKSTLCGVCDTNPGKYKCPRCRMP
ncbi:zinc finger HIT domain-containing protein [Candidatus Bathyarchaeota archaeon]|nr:zinc finger HIT domain-containing protein [Candidatus Bathyarchaeota archaeon]